ncbi:MAG: SDR family NAD(P)-dependent oxidoreductase, partial [Lysobacter sp.]|nr:SDR family NAD(P)-dependent oxidoreductase [Lysobacter sp.]
MAKLDKAVAIVTGASSGIGKSTAQMFAREGAAVVVVHHYHPDEAKKVVDAIAAAGGRAIMVAADVRDEGEVDMVFEQAHKAFGAPTILVNAAGVDAAGIPVADMKLEQFKMVLRTNLVGPFLFCRAFVRGC